MTDERKVGVEVEGDEEQKAALAAAWIAALERVAAKDAALRLACEDMEAEERGVEAPKRDLYLCAFRVVGDDAPTWRQVLARSPFEAAKAFLLEDHRAREVDATPMSHGRANVPIWVRLYGADTAECYRVTVKTEIWARAGRGVWKAPTEEGSAKARRKRK